MGGVGHFLYPQRRTGVVSLFIGVITQEDRDLVPPTLNLQAAVPATNTVI